MLGLNRQIVSEFFLVLLAVCLLNRGPNRLSSTILAILFASALIVSHYALSYVFMIAMASSIFLMYLWKLPSLFRPPDSNSEMVTGGRQTLGQHRSNKMLTPWFVLTFASMTVAWYLYVSGGVS